MQVVCKFDMKSVDVLIRVLRAMLEGAIKDAGEELQAVGEGIMAESYIECPRDTGALAGSGYVKEPVRIPGGVHVELGYGGPADQRNPRTGQMTSSYMVPVHEDPMAIHPYGKWKFLEDPVRRNEVKLVEQLGNRIRVSLTIRPGG